MPSMGHSEGFILSLCTLLQVNLLWLFKMIFMSSIQLLTLKMYFTKVQTIETFKEIYADDLKELFGQKKIKDSLFKSHVQSLIEAKLLNPNKVKTWVNPF